MKLTEQNWKPYFGNNNVSIQKPDVFAFGSVSFAKHIGRELSQELWEDLIHRMCIKGLCIYKPNDTRWCIGWGGGHCIICLDNEDKVKDVEYQPKFHSCKKECKHKEDTGNLTDIVF